MFPAINRGAELPSIISSQSAGQLPGDKKLGKAKKRSKRSSSENSLRKPKRLSNEYNSDDVAKLAKRTKRSSISKKQAEFRQCSFAEDDGSVGKKKVKTGKVKVHTKQLMRQFSSKVFSGKADNPFREVVTKNMLEEGSPAANNDIKLFWLYTVALISRTAFIEGCKPESILSTETAISAARARFASNVRLVMYIKRRCRWFRHTIKAKTDFVRNHGWKIILFWRCTQRRKAVVLLRRMLHDYESFRLPYVMLRYRVNAVHLQRYVRSFLEVTACRKQVLLMKWRKISADMNANLIRYLFEQKAKEEEERRRKAQDKWQGVEIDAELLPDIAPRVNLITKRTAALQHQINKSEETIQKRRKEMFERKKMKKKAKNAKLPQLGNLSTTNYSTIKNRDGHMRSSHDAADDKEISSIISKFVYECRRTCKLVEQHKVIIKEQKKRSGMTCEEAKKILTNPFAAKMFAEELNNTEVKLERIKLFIFTGDQDTAFRLLIENHLRAENQFELTEFCTEYDLYHK